LRDIAELTLRDAEALIKAAGISPDAKYARRVNAAQSRGTELIPKLLNLRLTFPPAEEFRWQTKREIL